MLSGYDCIMIPGAMKTDGNPAPAAHCGYDKGIATANDGAAKTICCELKFL